LRIKSLLRDWRQCLFTKKLNRSLFLGLFFAVYRVVNVEYYFLGSRRAFGGILLMCDRRVVERIEACVGAFSVACSFRSVDNNFEWAFAGVYGHDNDKYRKMF
jgi:hypothetical protein